MYSEIQVPTAQLVKWNSVQLQFDRLGSSAPYEKKCLMATMLLKGVAQVSGIASTVIAGKIKYCDPETAKAKKSFCYLLKEVLRLQESEIQHFVSLNENEVIRYIDESHQHYTGEDFEDFKYRNFIREIRIRVNSYFSSEHKTMIPVILAQEPEVSLKRKVSSLNNPHPYEYAVDVIFGIIEEEFEEKRKHIASPSRKRIYTYPRYMIMSLLEDLYPDVSLQTIADTCGKTDHATVTAARKKHHNLLSKADWYKKRFYRVKSKCYERLNLGTGSLI